MSVPYTSYLHFGQTHGISQQRTHKNLEEANPQKPAGCKQTFPRRKCFNLNAYKKGADFEINIQWKLSNYGSNQGF